jgi:hypothetical protein
MQPLLFDQFARGESLVGLRLPFDPTCTGRVTTARFPPSFEGGRRRRLTKARAQQPARPYTIERNLAFGVTRSRRYPEQGRELSCGHRPGEQMSLAVVTPHLLKTPSWAYVSTPSPTAVMPSAWAIAVIAPTIAQAPVSVGPRP